MIGTKLGRWKITEEIGDGGHAFVFKGRCNDEVAAIKMLKPSVASEENLEKRESAARPRRGLFRLVNPAIGHWRRTWRDQSPKDRWQVVAAGARER